MSAIAGLGFGDQPLGCAKLQVPPPPSLGTQTIGPGAAPHGQA
jgi:hypothetical protein